MTPQERALALLREHLTEEQRLSMDSFRCFYVKGSDDRRYRISCDWGRYGHCNVTRYTHDGYAEYTRHAAWPGPDPTYYNGDDQRLPDGDIWLAQKLWLENAAGAFLDVACGYLV